MRTLSFGSAFLAALAATAAAQSPPSLSPTLYPMNPTGLLGIVSADFNGDGFLDFAGARLSNSPAPLYILVSQGPTYLANPNPPLLPFATIGIIIGLQFDMAAADLDNDGDIDLAASDLGDGVERFAGDGAGNFTDVGLLTFANPPIGGAPVTIRTLRAADVSGDGIVDLVVASAAQNAIGIRLGTAQGGFAPSYFLPNPLGNLTKLDLGEFNGDGVLDYALAGNTSQLTIALGTPGGGVGATTTKFVDPAAFGQIVAGDLNGDSHSDLVFSGILAFSIVMQSILCDGGGGFVGNATTFNTSNSGAIVPGIADFDADGFGDVALSPNAGADLLVYTNDGQGGFGAPPLSISIAPGSTCAGTVARDVDGDGRIDVASTHLAQDVVIFQNVTNYHAGLAPFNFGTQGCAGFHGVNANQAPQIGSPGFRYLFTNAPPNTLGLGLASDAVAGGLDPFGLGIEFYVGLAGATEIYAYDLFADARGNAFANVPLPNIPGLVGKTYFLQGIFLTTGACKPSQFGLSSSRGLAVTVQP